MLKTSEAASLLGVSRQHVVDLCNSDRLEHSVVGRHRRVPRSAVESMLRPTLSEEKMRSLWLHRVVLGELIKDPERVIASARVNLAAAQLRHSRASVYLDAWETVLDGGVEEIARALTASDERSCDLRQNTPFAGVLDEPTRQAVLRSFRRSRGR